VLYNYGNPIEVRIKPVAIFSAELLQKGLFPTLDAIRRCFQKDWPGTYQESCPLGVLELRTSMQLTSI